MSHTSRAFINGHLSEPLAKFFEKHPKLDWATCRLFQRGRLSLPRLSLPTLFADFDEQPVELKRLPRGGSSTPLGDVVMLMKIVRCVRPRRLMEAGSFRGYTALLLAQHTEPEAALVTVDRVPEHGEAYRGTPWAEKIERRVGTIEPALFAGDAPKSYDFIFLDAGHTYEDVKYDTEMLLPLLVDDGYFVWHDYGNWGYYSHYNGVPEYLHELGAEIPIAHVVGSDLAIHAPAWKTTRAEAYRKALNVTSTLDRNYWETDALRGSHQLPVFN